MERLQSNMTYKRRQGHRQHEDDRVKTAVLTAVMCPHTRQCPGLPEAGRDRKDSLLEASKGAWPCLHADCGLLASRTETIHSCL